MKLKKPEIKSWDCTDHDPIEDWVPDDRSLVEYWCNVSIGIEGEEGAGNFQVHVVTERMLSQIENKDFMIVLPYYEGWNQVIDAIKERLEEIRDLNWAGMQGPLSKLFMHEYGRYDQ